MNRIGAWWTVTATLAAVLLASAAQAQQPPAQPACMTRAEVSAYRQRSDAFLDANTSQLRQADMDKVRAMLDRVFEPMRQAAATNCSGTNRDTVRNEVRKEFEQLYSQVGVGGRMLFDNYQVPLYQDQWLGGLARR